MVLAAPRWRAEQAAHEARVDALVAGHLARAAAGTVHPVEDFLFTYYSFRPSQLRRWAPGAGTALAADGGPFPALRDHVVRTVPGPDGRAVDALTLEVEAFLARRGDAVRHIRTLLAATASRAPALGCFGLHEWAMVYRLAPDDVRHRQVPLRLGPAGTDAVVESHRVRCTHFDAFRFFTPDALPRNEFAPTRDSQVELEQPGCLHATMDLYKLAHKLAPATPSSLVADCFALARDVRTLDMQASPYDLAALGYPPVRIETADGKAEYTARQREFVARAQPLRAALLAVCDRLLDTPTPDVTKDLP